MWEDSYLSMSCLHRMCRNDRQHPILLSQNHSFERWHLNRYSRLMLVSTALQSVFMTGRGGISLVAKIETRTC